MKLTLVAGARPNFMKISPVIDAISDAAARGKDITFRLVHTGQHYDRNMSGSFFEQLGIPEPHANLECGGGTQAEQAAAIMIAFERELLQNPADLVLVVGDVTSTMACSITAKKLCVDVAHVEGGIRSGDMTMPEEVNRMVTDAISDYFFTTSETANANLRNSGISADRIFFVGNTMIDTLLKHTGRFTKPAFFDLYGLQQGKYFVVTLHRPANVDEETNLEVVLRTIIDSARGLPVIFPVHPRTARKLEQLSVAAPNLYLIEPLDYLSFNYLVKNSLAVVTDSGGITEETTVLGIPCLTLRDNTERPETITIGTNELIGTDPVGIPPAMDRLFAGKWKKGNIPELWDGRTSERIVAIIDRIYNS